MNETGIKKSTIFERLVQITMAALVLGVFIIFANGIATHAEDEGGGSLEILEINYNTSTITIAADAKDTMLYLSNETQKKWEYIPEKIVDKAYKTQGGDLYRDEGGNLVEAVAGDPSKSYKVVELDFSWITFTKNYAMSFKGDYSTTPIKVILPKQATNVKVTYDVASGKVSFTNVADGQTVQWKKKEAIAWNTYNEAEFEETIKSFIDNGTSLMFRTAPINGTSVEECGKRPSKEVILNVPKKTAAPAITVDDERMTVKVKKGLWYRIVDEQGNNPTAWQQFTKEEDYPLAELAPDAMWTSAAPGAVPPKDVYIQFYQGATSGTQMSKRRTIKIPAQIPLTASDTSEENTKFIYTSNTAFEMIFKTVGDSNPIEYCIITKDMQNLGITLENDPTNSNIKWNSVEGGATVKKSLASDSSLVNDSIVYYRRKAQGKLGESNYKLASPFEELARITYPDGASLEGFKLLRTIEGMCRNGSNTLGFTFTSGSKGEIKKVELRTNGGSAGTAKFTYNVAEVSGTSKYIYSVTLTDLSGVTKTGELLYVYVYIGDESSYETASVQSNGTNGVGLYIYPKSEVKNPSGETQTVEVARKLAEAENPGWSDYSYENDTIKFETAFKRVFMSNRIGTNADARQFRIKVDMGSLEKQKCEEKTSPINCEEYYAGENITVTKLKYDGVDLNSSYFTVQYYTDTETVDDVEREYRVAVITVNAKAIEDNVAVDDRDKDTPLYIFLSNGEVLKDSVTINFQRTANVTEATSFAFTEGLLEDYRIITDKNGAETKERKLDDYYKINLTVPSNLGGKSNYDVGVSTVKWGGSNILYSAKKNGNTITITLDNALLNKIEVTSSQTHDIEIEFTNGYRLISGIPMTISPATH